MDWEKVESCFDTACDVYVDYPNFKLFMNRDPSHKRWELRRFLSDKALCSTNLDLTEEQAFQWADEMIDFLKEVQEKTIRAVMVAVTAAIPL